MHISSDQLASLLIAVSEAQKNVAALRPNTTNYARFQVEEFWTPEPVIAYRYWRLGGSPPTLLTGPNGRPWRKNYLEARHEGQPGLHDSPSWGCNCGINAAKTMDQVKLLADCGDPRYVYGEIELTGIVHEYERGYRGQIGHIKKLYLWTPNPEWMDRVYYSHIDQYMSRKEIAERLSTHYKVPVDVFR